jgi:hypothetical protein
MYIVLQIQLGCTYGSTFIYLNVSDPKTFHCLINKICLFQTNHGPMLIIKK